MNVDLSYFLFNRCKLILKNLFVNEIHCICYVNGQKTFSSLTCDPCLSFHCYTVFYHPFFSSWAFTAVYIYRKCKHVPFPAPNSYVTSPGQEWYAKVSDQSSPLYLNSFPILLFPPAVVAVFSAFHLLRPQCLQQKRELRFQRKHYIHKKKRIFSYAGFFLNIFQWWSSFSFERGYDTETDSNTPLVCKDTENTRAIQESKKWASSFSCIDVSFFTYDHEFEPAIDAVIERLVGYRT